jgi:hypothetical protein
LLFCPIDLMNPPFLPCLGRNTPVHFHSDATLHKVPMFLKHCVVKMWFRHRLVGAPNGRVGGLVRQNASSRGGRSWNSGHDPVCLLVGVASWCFQRNFRSTRLQESMPACAVARCGEMRLARDSPDLRSREAALSWMGCNMPRLPQEKERRGRDQFLSIGQQMSDDL